MTQQNGGPARPIEQLQTKLTLLMDPCIHCDAPAVVIVAMYELGPRVFVTTARAEPRGAHGLCFACGERTTYVPSGTRWVPQEE